MKVVIRLAELQAHKACDAYLRSPEWDEKEQALVYPDWDATVARHLTGEREKMGHLEWMVANKLVPMTAQELFSAKQKARGTRNG